MKSIFKPPAGLFRAAAVCLMALSCGKSDPTAPVLPEHSLTLVSEVTLPFSGLSGIAYSEELQRLWVVSGGNQHIYRLDMSGQVEKKLDFIGTDLEGIAFDGTDSTLWTIDELTKDITHLDLNGNVLSTHNVNYTTTSNKGPEGITIGRNHTFYILNERNPAILIKLDSQFAFSDVRVLDFALDYSDVTYDSTRGSFYILSDETGAFFEWSETGGVLSRYRLQDTGNEGIAYDRLRKVFYITNKTTDRLSIYTE